MMRTKCKIMVIKLGWVFHNFHGKSRIICVNLCLIPFCRRYQSLAVESGTPLPLSCLRLSLANFSSVYIQHWRSRKRSFDGESCANAGYSHFDTGCFVSICLHTALTQSFRCQGHLDVAALKWLFWYGHILTLPKNKPINFSLKKYYYQVMCIDRAPHPLLSPMLSPTL